MQNKTPMSYHLTSVVNCYYKKDKEQQVLARMWRKANHTLLQISRAIIKKSVEIPQKIKNRTIM
jgi:hypothetical protein